MQVFHPNIDMNGRVGIRILGDQWSAALSVEKLLLSISSILLDPIVLDGHNPVSDLYWHERDYCSNKKTTRLEKQYVIFYFSCNVTTYDELNSENINFE